MCFKDVVTEGKGEEWTWKKSYLSYHNWESAHNGLFKNISVQIICASYLYPKDAEYDEESTADENNVADGFEGSDEGLHHQLQTWSSADHPGEKRGGRKTSPRSRMNKNWRR